MHSPTHALRSLRCAPPPTRLLIVPGLHDSGSAHWQTWLQGLHRHSLRVVQPDWDTPDLERWSERIAATIERGGPGPWLVAAHSFGVLAFAHGLAHHGVARQVNGALLVAPADPDRFGLAEALPQGRLPGLNTLVASQTDPWMHIDQAARWARRWGCHLVNLGDAGHINAEAGFGPLPMARSWVLAMEQRLAREHHAAEFARPSSFAVSAVG